MSIILRQIGGWPMQMGRYNFVDFDVERRAYELAGGAGSYQGRRSISAESRKFEDRWYEIRGQLEIIQNTKSALLAGVYLLTAGGISKIGETQNVHHRVSGHDGKPFSYAGRTDWRLRAWLPIPYDPVCPETGVVRPWSARDEDRPERREIERRIHEYFTEKRIEHKGVRELFQVSLKEFRIAAAEIYPRHPVLEISGKNVSTRPLSWEARRNAKMLRAIMKNYG